MHRILRTSATGTFALLLLAACGGGGGGGGGTSVLGAPSGLGMEPAARMVTLSWEAVTGATAYNVYLATSPSVSPENYDVLPEGRHAPGVPGLTVRFEGLTDGATYWAVVAAQRDGDEGPVSAPVSALLPVGQVHNVATKGDPSTVRVVWLPTLGASAYEVFVAGTSDVSDTFYDRRLDTDTNWAVVDGLTNGQPYWFVVRARNVNGAGPLSNPVAGTPSGLGTLGDVTVFPAGAGATDLLLADLDADGREEVVVANRDAGTVQVFAAAASPPSARDPFVLVGELPLGDDVPTGIAVLDADQDGVPDLAIARRDAGTVTIHLGLGDGTFWEWPWWTVAVGAEPADLLAVDVNADGFTDLLSADHGGPGLTLALGQSLEPHGELVLVDPDLDLWDWLWVYPDPFLPPVTAATLNGPVALAAGDIDGDGDVDLLEVEDTFQRMTVLTNDGTGAFSLDGYLSLPCLPDSVELADITHDGGLDALLSSRDGDCVILAVNDGTGHFVIGSELEPGPAPVQSIATDMDGDALLDVVVADLDAGTVTVFIGNGYGGFHEHFVLAPCGSVARVTATDVDGDGFQDLVVSDPVAGCVLILYGAEI